MESLNETFTSASKVALLLLICNFTYNIGILDGSVTTADLIQTSIPNFVWLISLFYTVPGEQRIYSRKLKSVFFVIGLVGIGVLCFSDYLANPGLLRGALVNILCSVCYGVYAVALSAVAGDDDDFDYGLFLGFVGLINVVILIPMMIALHIWGF